jgi:magnesium chelatase family protein
VQHGETSAAVRDRVVHARTRQHKRYATPLRLNGALSVRELRDACAMEPEAATLLERAAAQLHLSARAVHRVLRVARTIADLGSEETLEASHLAEALQYRTPFHEIA